MNILGLFFSYNGFGFNGFCRMSQLTFEEKYACMAQGVAWDLGELYSGNVAHKASQDLDAVLHKARKFASRYTGKWNHPSIDVPIIVSALKEYESIHDMGMIPNVFAFLNLASNTQDHSRNRLFTTTNEKWLEISQMIMPFCLDIAALPAGTLKHLANTDALSNYRHFFEHLMQRRPYLLSKTEENIIKSKYISGRDAFCHLFDELLGSLSFKVEAVETNRKFNMGEVLALLHDPDKSLREKAFQTCLEQLGSQGILFKNILNALILDYHIENKTRGYSTPMHRRHLSNEVTEGMVETMMGIVEDHYPLARRYFQLKARLLDMGHLKITDIFAPLINDPVRMRFAQARELVLAALAKFHPLFYSTANDFFQKNRIDAELRKGKAEGAFCKCLAPSHSPYISLGFSGSLKDIMTLAHELGHGVHYALSSGHSYLNFNPPPVLSETASAFFELLLVRHLMVEEGYQGLLPNLIASHVEGIFTAVFRQGILTRFEQAIHLQRQDHLLSEQEFCSIWKEQNYKLFEEDVEMIPGFGWGWTYIPHFVHRPFYCYSYIFGSLVAIRLFQVFLERGADFKEDIICLYRSGGSRAPLDLLRGMGLDPEDRAFWEPAFQYIGGLIDSLE